MNNNNEIGNFNNPEEAIEWSKNFFKNKLELLSKGRVLIDFNTFQGKVLESILNVIGQGIYLLQDLMRLGVRQFFPNTANEYYLKTFWGDIFGMEPILNTYSIGYICVNGEENKSIPIGTLLYNGSNNYQTTEIINIVKYQINTSKIEEVVSGFIDITFNQNFIIADNILLDSITGDYNDTNKEIKVLNERQIRIEKKEGEEILGNNAVCVFYLGIGQVQSLETGEKVNKPNGTELNFNQTLDGISKKCYVAYDGLNGGVDEESVEKYRERILNIFSNVLQGWNTANIENTIRNYNNGQFFYSKIFIPRAEKMDGTSEASWTTIYMIKNDLSLLSELDKTNLKNELDKIYPIKDINNHCNFQDIVLKQCNIQIKLLNDKNTFDMKKAVENFFINDFQQDNNYCFFRKNIFIEDLRFNLLNIIDNNGVVLDKDFEIISPTETITLEYNEFPIININFVEE